ncbi:MAG: PorT family protein [Bacteroidetes bacterium]|nr:PorT family protein [Bacteroidota bacterium]MBL7102888.1 PorT family protein [Bacteroidales bacterium]
MKNTVKILTIAVLFAISYQSFAQTFGIKAGLNLANMTIKDDEETYSDDLKMRPGFNVGGMVEITLVNDLSLQSGLFISQKGYKYEFDDNWKGSVSLLYAEIPVTAKYTFDVGKVGIYGETGPYFGMGLTGWYKSEFEGEKDSDNIVFGKDEDFKLLDIGIRFGAGVEISSVQIGLYYDLGLANISHDDSGGYKMTNKVLGFTVGYWFGNKK